AEAFGESGNVPGEFRGDGSEGRRPGRGKKAVWIILHDGYAEAPRHLGDCNPSSLRDRVRSGVEQRRIEIKRLRSVARAGLCESIGIDTLVVHGQADEIQAELSRDRTSARIGEVF